MRRKFLKRKKYDNPFLPRRSEIDLARKKKKKRIFLVILFFLLICGLVYLIFYSAIWRIKKIVITGTEEINVITEIREIVQKEKTGYCFFVIPNDNILFFSIEELVKRIDGEMVLDELDVQKKFFKTLKIYAKEKVPVLVWNEGDEYYYIDKKGIVMGAVNFNDIKYDLSFINRGTTTQVVVSKKIIEPVDVDFILKILAEAGNKFKDWQINQVMAKKIKNNEIYFYTDESWYFLLDMAGDSGKQLENLDRLLEQKIGDRSALEYIDLRIEDRIFYKTLNYKL